MRYIDDRDVNEAVTEMVRVLGQHDAEDGSVPAGSWNELLTPTSPMTCSPTPGRPHTPCAGLLGSARPRPARRCGPGTPAPLCAAVLHQLFPGAPPGAPAYVLLWCTGRGDLDDRPHRSEWTLQALVAESSDRRRTD
jgi:hypothetical protein